MILRQHQNLFLIGLLQGKCLKSFMISFANDDILFLIKILVKSHFMLMKWVFLVKILIKLSDCNFDDDNNFYDDDPDAIIYVRFLA